MGKRQLNILRIVFYNGQIALRQANTGANDLGGQGERRTILMDNVARRARGTERMLDILEYWQTPRDPIGLGVLAERLSFPRSTVYVLAEQLIERGWLERDENGEIVLGHRAGKLGLAYAQHAKFEQYMREAVQRLARELGNVVEVSIVDNWQQLILISSTGKEHNYLRATEGTVVPLPRTGSGLLLLEGVPRQDIERNIRKEHFRMTDGTYLSIDTFLERMDEARKQGYAVARGLLDYYIGVICVAIRNKDGRVVAALNVVMPMEELDTNLDKFLNKLKETANDLSRILKIVSWPIGDQVLQAMDRSN